MSEFSEDQQPLNGAQEHLARMGEVEEDHHNWVLNNLKDKLHDPGVQEIYSDSLKQLGVEAVKVEVDEPPAAGARTEQQIVADIQSLQLMGDAACLTDEIRPKAQALLDEWLNLPDFGDRIRVVPQRSKGDPAWKRINIQRGQGDRPLANPYQLKRADGTVIRTAAEASELFWGDFAEQILEDTPQRQKMQEIAALLKQGERIELGCCGHDDCHGHYIRDELVDEWDTPPAAIDWLWDLLDSYVASTALPDGKQVVFVESPDSDCDEQEEPERIVVDVDEWVGDVTDVLVDGWQQFNRFLFATKDGSVPDGDLAAKATSLWLQHDHLDPVIAQPRFFELFWLFNELESHIDPTGVFRDGRQRCFNNRKAAELRAQGKHHEAAQWLLPKEEWERPKQCSKEQWANIIKPFNRHDYDEPVKEFLAKVELARKGLCAWNGKSGQEALDEHRNDAHTKIREAIERGDSIAQVQELINQLLATTTKRAWPSSPNNAARSWSVGRTSPTHLKTCCSVVRRRISTWPITCQSIGCRCSAFCGKA